MAIPDEGIVERVSADAFAPTLAKLTQAIERAGMMVFARIDHAAAARGVGLTMPETVVLLYGNPRGGTPVMLAAPRAALNLPLRVLVREGVDGQTYIAFHPIRHDLRDLGFADTLVAPLAAAQERILEAIGSRR